MDCKISPCGFGAKDLQQPFANPAICEYPLTVVAADGYEIELLALVMGLRYSDRFLKMHRYIVYLRSLPSRCRGRKASASEGGRYNGKHNDVGMAGRNYFLEMGMLARVVSQSRCMVHPVADLSKAMVKFSTLVGSEEGIMSMRAKSWSAPG
jgi:hypothetical protein